MGIQAQLADVHAHSVVIIAFGINLSSASYCAVTFGRF